MNNNVGGTGVQILPVAEDDDGTRLDKWMLRHFPGLGKGEIYKWMRKGQIRLDSGRVKPDTRVYAGQEVRIPPVPASAYQPYKKSQEREMTAEGRKKAREILQDMIVYEDDVVLVLNKPYGMATQGGTKVSQHIDGLVRALETDTVTPRLVHRLDKETSGILVVAKTLKAAQALGEAFKTRDAQKFYWAVVAPSPKMNDGIIEAPLAKGKSGGGERVMVDEESGKYARSEYWVIEKAHRKAAWVCLKPETGRTHQLRVHAALMGSPIIGDSKYNDPEMEIEIEDISHADKLHLHARRLIVPHPSGRGILDVTAPLPVHMRETFAYFEFDPQLGDELPEDMQP